MPRFAVILPAAGRSSRFGGKEKKPFASLDGRPVWLRTVELFVNRSDVAQCLLVIAPEDREMFEMRYRANIVFLNVTVIDGGSERFESVANGLAALSDEVDFVAVHDAVRPCTPPKLIEAVFTAAVRHGAALAAVPVHDTVKTGDAQHRVTGTLSRQGLWLAQTPQASRRDWLLDAYAKRSKATEPITDDAQLLELAGHSVVLVPGHSGNLKITTRDDLQLAQALLRVRQASEAANAPRPIHPFEDEQMWK